MECEERGAPWDGRPRTPSRRPASRLRRGAKLVPTPLYATGRSGSNTRVPGQPGDDARTNPTPLYVPGCSDGMHTTWPGAAFDGPPVTDWTYSDGFMTHRGLRLSPKEMRIRPLRSAVKIESDVSPDGSVTPGTVSPTDPTDSDIHISSEMCPA